MEKVPVTVIITRIIKPGYEAAFEDWLHGILAIARQFEGHLGAEILRPAPGSTPLEYTLFFRFDNVEHLKTWENSPERQAWLHKLEPMLAAAPRVQTITGLEYWFTLPNQRTPPPRYKMILVTWLALIPLSYLIGPQISQWLDFLPPFPRAVIVIGILTALMTYVVMPNMTRLLAWWLYPGA